MTGSEHFTTHWHKQNDLADTVTDLLAPYRKSQDCVDVLLAVVYRLAVAEELRFEMLYHVLHNFSVQGLNTREGDVLVWHRSSQDAQHCQLLL